MDGWGVKLTEEDRLAEAIAPEYSLPAWLFNHEELGTALDSARQVDLKTLINLLNYIHFVEGSILVHLHHPTYDEDIIIQGYPRPCTEKILSGYWSLRNLCGLGLQGYQFLSLVIEDGKSVILVPGKLLTLDHQTFKVELPDLSYVASRRQMNRYIGRNVSVELVQKGSVALGELIDFNPLGFRIKLDPKSSDDFDSFDTAGAFTVYMRGQAQVFFSCLCRCLRHHCNGNHKEVVMISEVDQIRRFEKRTVRNPRLRPTSAVNIVFEHPLVKEMGCLEVHDISTSGFSVYEKPGEEVLVAGLIIPSLSIHFVGSLSVQCTAQVIYRSLEREQTIRCGLAILDMDLENYTRLAQVIAGNLDRRFCVSDHADMNALWKFLFESGFISPKKYSLIQSRREEFKKTYQRLYQENPEIARHFIYRRRGVICGHISMIRAYQKAWMVHHHAAKAVDSKRDGLAILRQLMHYLNDMHRLPSTHADFVFSYFRPEKKFPNAVFGDFARSFWKTGNCSLDQFSYLSLHAPPETRPLESGWSLEKSSNADLSSLRRYYSHHSGGLLLEAFCLDQKAHDEQPLEEVYARLGFLRKLYTYSLKRNKRLQSVIVLNLSEEAFNLSCLLHGMHIFVTDPKDLDWNVLSGAVSQLAHQHGMGGFSVLIHPVQYVERNRIPFEKNYSLWIVNLRNRGGDAFMEYMSERFKSSYHSFGASLRSTMAK